MTDRGQEPRLGDAGTQAILEFVGENDRVKKQEAVRPEFDTDDETGDEAQAVDTAEELTASDDVTDEAVADESDQVEQQAEDSQVDASDDETAKDKEKS